MSVRDVVRIGDPVLRERAREVAMDELPALQGLIDDKMEPMSTRDVGGIINRGGTILYSARCKAFVETAGRAIAAKLALRPGGFFGSREPHPRPV